MFRPEHHLHNARKGVHSDLQVSTGASTRIRNGSRIDSGLFSIQVVLIQVVFCCLLTRYRTKRHDGLP